MKIGDVARRTRQIQQQDVELFASMTGDRNPVHFDPELAARSRFGGIVVQGGVTSGLLNARVAQDLPGPGSVFLHTDWSYLAPVRPGDVLTAEAVVLDLRSDKPISTLRTRSWNCMASTRTASCGNSVTDSVASTMVPGPPSARRA